MTDEAQRRGVSSRHTEKLVGKFDRFLQRSNSVLTEKYGDETAGGDAG